MYHVHHISFSIYVFLLLFSLYSMFPSFLCSLFPFFQFFIIFRIKINMVSESRRSGIKSAGRRRFFGSKNPSEHSADDAHRSTSKVLKSLFFHYPQRTDDVLSYVPSDPHVSLTSQTSYSSSETRGMIERGMIMGEGGIEISAQTIEESTEGKQTTSSIFHFNLLILICCF